MTEGMERQETGSNNAVSPTSNTYHSFDAAYEFFNQELFGSVLPGCLVTMQRKKNSGGYFSETRFSHRRGGNGTDEIALNPVGFIGQTDQRIISILVHEMAHQWQFHFGKPGRGRYHNKEWAAKMKGLGLYPSHTGQLGGKETGDSMSHYIVDGGAYATKWKELEASGFALDYQDRFADQLPNPRKLRVRYICPVCEYHAWGQGGAVLLCLRCAAKSIDRDNVFELRLLERLADIRMK